MRIFGYDINKANKYEVGDIDMRPVEPINKAEKPKERAVGMVALKSSSGRVEEEFLSELRWPDAGRVYQEMASNNAVVGACLYLIETIIRSAEWKVTAATDDTTEEDAKFLASCMHDMTDQTWDEFISEVLSMLTYGFSFHEIVYKVRRGPDEKDPRFRSKYSDGKIGWQELPVRSQASMMEWLFDETTGKPIAFVQDPGQVGAQGPVSEIPIDGNLLFKTKSSRNNPEGQSLLRRAYRSWYFCRYIEELEGIGIERNLAGIPHLQPSEDVNLFNPDDEEMVDLLGWAQDLVDGLRQDTNHGVITPNGWSLKLLGAEGSSKTIDTDKVIHRHESRIAMTMLADIVVMGGDRTGSFALGEVKQGLFLTSLQSIVNNICSMLNTKAVPKLFNLNGIVREEYPVIEATELKAPSLKEVALLLRSVKIDVTKNRTLLNFLLDLINAPNLTEEEFVEMLSISDEQSASEASDDIYQDNVEGDFKQSDMDYV